MFLMSLVFKRPVFNGVNNGEECAQRGPLTMVKKKNLVIMTWAFMTVLKKRLIGILTSLIKQNPFPFV